MSYPYVLLTRYKRWADHGLHEVVARNLGRLDAQDATILVRILDHIHVVDRIFQHHLQGTPHAFSAPVSSDLPDFRTLADESKLVDDWFASYAGALSGDELEQRVEFVFTNGASACMTRGEIILHVCLHGSSHRGTASFLLQKNGIVPHKDRMTDFIETAA
jgi:uncharacterized damage-inducible protein DinB